MKIMIEIETKNMESVKAYLREILGQMSKNRHFSIVGYRMENIEINNHWRD